MLRFSPVNILVELFSYNNKTKLKYLVVAKKGCRYQTVPPPSAQVIYSRPGPTERLEDTPLYQNLTREHPTAPVIREFLIMLAICHTVIPETKGDTVDYHAASPGTALLASKHIFVTSGSQRCYCSFDNLGQPRFLIIYK